MMTEDTKSDAAQRILKAATAAGYQQSADKKPEGVLGLVKVDGEKTFVAVKFTYDGRVQTFEVNNTKKYGMGRDAIIAWFNRELRHASAPKDSQLSAAYAAAKRLSWNETYPDGIKWRLSDTYINAWFSDAGRLTRVKRARGTDPEEIPDADKFATLMHWLEEGPTLVVQERFGKTPDSYAHLKPDRREEKLPQWARDKLNKLRDDRNSYESLYNLSTKELEEMREAAENDSGDDTGMRYETEYSVMHLPAGGTLYVRVGREEVTVAATEDGIALGTLAKGLAVYPHAFRALEIRVIPADSVHHNQ